MLYNAAEAIRLSGVLLEPVPRAYARAASGTSSAWTRLRKVGSGPTPAAGVDCSPVWPCNKSEPLFPRIDLEEALEGANAQSEAGEAKGSEAKADGTKADKAASRQSRRERGKLTLRR